MRLQYRQLKREIISKIHLKSAEYEKKVSMERTQTKATASDS